MSSKKRTAHLESTSFEILEGFHLGNTPIMKGKFIKYHVNDNDDMLPDYELKTTVTPIEPDTIFEDVVIILN